MSKSPLIRDTWGWSGEILQISVQGPIIVSLEHWRTSRIHWHDTRVRLNNESGRWNLVESCGTSLRTWLLSHFIEKSYPSFEPGLVMAKWELPSVHRQLGTPPPPFPQHPGFNLLLYLVWKENSDSLELSEEEWSVIHRTHKTISGLLWGVHREKVTVVGTWLQNHGEIHCGHTNVNPTGKRKGRGYQILPQHLNLQSHNFSDWRDRRTNREAEALCGRNSGLTWPCEKSFISPLG